MKRSEINQAIKGMEALIKEHGFELPPFCKWTPGDWAEKRGRWGKCCLGLCVLASAVCFCLFYPVISALRVPQGYVAGWLEWLPGWDFIS